MHRREEQRAAFSAIQQTTFPVQPGRVARQDYEYKREGTANIFIMVEPLAGKRWVRVTERRTKADFAEEATHHGR